MSDAEPATRRTRRSAALRDLDTAIAERDAAITALRRAQNLWSIDRTRGRRAEILLGRTVAALSQWRNDAGDLDARAADALVFTLGDVLSIPADQRPEIVLSIPADQRPDAYDAGDHPEHPDDDEPPTEP